MNMSITCADEEYGGLITRFVSREFEINCDKQSCVFDNVYQSIIGTRQTRYGALPTPENLVKIRQAIKHAMEREEPIQFHTPWGSEKPGGGGIDIAELSALKQLKALQDQVQKYYSPGITITLAIEDLTALHLFADRREQALREARLYSDGLVNIIKIMGLDHFIWPALESKLCTYASLELCLADFEPHMVRYLTETTLYGLDSCQDRSSYQALVAQGWKGIIPQEQRDYYLNTYAKLYPNKSKEEHIKILAAYFSESWARYRLGIRALPLTSHIKLAFHTPVPGVDPGATIFYRTLPRSQTANHIAPWRAKGYLEMSQDEGMCAKVTNYSNFDILNDLIHTEIMIGDQLVSTDYLINY